MTTLIRLKQRYINKRWGYNRLVRPVSRASLYWLTPYSMFTVTALLRCSKIPQAETTSDMINSIVQILWVGITCLLVLRFLLPILRAIGLKRIPIIFALGIPLIMAFLLNCEFFKSLFLVIPCLALAYLFLRQVFSLPTESEKKAKSPDTRGSTIARQPTN